MSTGWIKLHRKLLKWEWYQNSEMVHLFIHLVLVANHNPKKWQGITIERGQLATGRKRLKRETGLSEQVIRTCLKRLKSTNEITIKSTNRFSILTVCNYDSYNLDPPVTNQQTVEQLTNNQPATNQQLTTNKKDKNVKKDKNKEKASVSFPDSLDNTVFREAWTDWMKYLVESRKKPTQITINRQLKFLSKQPEDAVVMIEKSIQNGWQGLFPLGEKNERDKIQKQSRTGQSQTNATDKGSGNKHNRPSLNEQDWDGELIPTT